VRFQLVPAAYVLLLRADEVLLQVRKDTGWMDGYWAVAAAGHVEKGESVLAAASREAAEELGVKIAPDDLEPVTAMHRTGGDGLPIDERVDFFFAVRRWVGEPRLMEPAKAADLRWFPLDALPDPVVPHELYVLEGIRSGTVSPIVTFGFR
jgi:8-oxo-dGTP pyrophosphatase MutT (NUDIX family)